MTEEKEPKMDDDIYVSDTIKTALGDIGPIRTPLTDRLHREQKAALAKAAADDEKRLRAEYDRMDGIDSVAHPPHYTQHPSGIECIEITRHMGFNLGNAVKYIWRAGLKGGSVQKEIEDLEKAVWCLEDRIGTLRNEVRNGRA